MTEKLPTEAMIEAGLEAGRGLGRTTVKGIYLAMQAARKKEVGDEADTNADR